MIRNVVFAAAALSLAGCATLTSDAMTPVALSFSDGSSGSCQLTNKRGAWSAKLPATTMVRRSDDPLQYQCRSKDGRVANGQMDSTVGAKIVASAVFIDFGITDAITDKHREYPASFVIPIQARSASRNVDRQERELSQVSEHVVETRTDDSVSESVAESTDSSAHESLIDAMRSSSREPANEPMAESASDSSAESDGNAAGGGLLGGANSSPKGGLMGGAVNDSAER